MSFPSSAAPFSEGSPVRHTKEELLANAKSFAANRSIPDRGLTTYYDLGFRFHEYKVITKGRVPRPKLDTNRRQVVINLPHAEAQKIARWMGVEKYKAIQLVLRK